jgi:hypothetical protein
MRAELGDVAGRIRRWQEERKISDSQMLRDFAGLGSTKTYTRIVAGDVEDLDCERWARDYAAVWSLIGLLSEAQSDNDEIYSDLTSGEQAGLTILEVFATDLDGANGFTHIRCDVADPTAAKVLDVLYILHGLNYAAAPESQVDPLV